MEHGGKRLGAGRPKGSKAPHTLEIAAAKEHMVKKIIEELDEMLLPQIEKAKQGDSVAFKNLLNRAFGRPKESVVVEDDVILKIDI